MKSAHFITLLTDAFIEAQTTTGRAEREEALTQLSRRLNALGNRANIRKERIMEADETARTLADDMLAHKRQQRQEAHAVFRGAAKAVEILALTARQDTEYAPYRFCPEGPFNEP